MAITTETLAAVAALRAQVQSMTSTQTLALTKAWVEAWDALLPEFEASIAEVLDGAAGTNVPRVALERNARLQAALQSARQSLEVLSPEAEGIITRDLPQLVADALDGHSLIITSQLPPNAAAAGVGFTRIPIAATNAIITRTTEQIHSSLIPLPANVEAVMKRALVRGIAVGENSGKTARRIIKDTEGTFNGGLTRALVISRTETQDAYRAATKASEAGNEQLLTEWEWAATFGPRTCPSCLSKHGQRFPLSEDGPLDHHQGRCARVTVTKSWKELGFDIEEPASATRDARAWFDNLTEDSQVGIMGAERLKLLQSGSITWEDLSQKRETTGWRDSFAPTPLKDLQAKAERK